jgi:hypothetical protein
MLNSTLLPRVVKTHQNNLLKEVNKSRLPKAIRNAGPRLYERLLGHVGDVLISAGTRLQARYKPTICLCPEYTSE